MSFISMVENTAAGAASRIDISSSASELISNKIMIIDTHSEIGLIPRAVISFDHWKSITSSNAHRPCLGYAAAGNTSRGSTGNNLIGSVPNFKYREKRKRKK